MASNEAVMEVLASGQVECCMCGDYGLLTQLFQCKVCLFRSQHRYCSNLYPMRNESFRVCNWCLKKEKENTEGTTTTSPTISSSSSSCNNNFKKEAKDRKKAGLIKKKNNSNTNEGNRHDEVLHINNSLKKSRSSSADKSLGRLQIHSLEIGNNNKEMKKQMFKDLSSSWSNESADQIQSNVTWSDHTTNANEDHLESRDRGMINMSKEELKIRSELEMDIERDLEAEIKYGICRLALKLQQLYQHQRERAARELSTNRCQLGRKKSVLTEMNVIIRMEGGCKVEINKMKKQKDQPKPFSRYKQGKTFQVGKEFNWVRTLRSKAASCTNSAKKKKNLKSQIHRVVEKNNVSTVNEDQDREESTMSNNVLKKLTDEKVIKIHI